MSWYIHVKDPAAQRASFTTVWTLWSLWEVQHEGWHFTGIQFHIQKTADSWKLKFWFDLPTGKTRLNPTELLSRILFLCPRSLQSTSGAKHWTRAIKGSEKVITKQSASQFTYQLVIKVDSSTLNTLKAVSWTVVLMHASLALLWQTVGHLPLPCPAATSLSWHPRDSLGTQGTLWTQTQCCLKLAPRAPSFHSCQLRPDTAPEAPLAGSSRTCWVPGSALIFSAIPDTPPTWVECWGLHPVATGFSKNFSRPFIVHSIYFRWATGVRDVGVAKGIKLLKCSF